MAVVAGRQVSRRDSADSVPLTVDRATRLGGTIIGTIAFGAALGGAMNPAYTIGGAVMGGLLGVAFAVVARKA